MAGSVSFDHVSMCWNAADVKPFAFDNTMTVPGTHPVDHLLAWSAVVAREAPGGRLKALVINCHGNYNFDYTSTTDSAGGIPQISGGFGLKIGSGIDWKNAGTLFRALAGLVGEIHLYACGTANNPTVLEASAGQVSLCQTIADASRAIVVGSAALQPDVTGPGLNLAPVMTGKPVRYAPH